MIPIPETVEEYFEAKKKAANEDGIRRIRKVSNAVTSEIEELEAQADAVAGESEAEPSIPDDIENDEAEARVAPRESP